MVFSSMVFLCVFLPAVFLSYCLIPGIKGKNALLLAASLIFYAYGEPVYVFLMLGSAFWNYLTALWIGKCPEKKKMILALAVTVDLLLLAVFKYAAFLTECVNVILPVDLPVPQIRLPIGISFFTFQAMSYVIDVYRGVNRAQKSYAKVLLYISFFPQLIAGPIVKYHDIEMEIEDRSADIGQVQAGMRRFCAGLCKKVLIANTMAVAADALFGAAKPLINAPAAWLGAVAYLFQIYFDFSGYSDMAIGLGLMFGFHFRENFQYPYASGSMTQFWRRWHISLSSWFREYLYIPLGGNRKGRVRTAMNKMAVFLCTGLWHGANLTFLFWGFYHGCLLMLEEAAAALVIRKGKIKAPRTGSRRAVTAAAEHLYTVLAVTVGFVIFRADTLTEGLWFIRQMFTGWHFAPESMSLVRQQMHPLFIAALAAAVIACCPVVPALKTALDKKKGQKALETFADVLSLAGLLLCLLSLAGGAYNPFIYFRF